MFVGCNHLQERFATPCAFAATALTAHRRNDGNIVSVPVFRWMARSLRGVAEPSTRYRAAWHGTTSAWAANAGPGTRPGRGLVVRPGWQWLSNAQQVRAPSPISVCAKVVRSTIYSARGTATSPKPDAPESGVEPDDAQRDRAALSLQPRSSEIFRAVLFSDVT